MDPLGLALPSKKTGVSAKRKRIESALNRVGTSRSAYHEQQLQRAKRPKLSPPPVGGSGSGSGSGAASSPPAAASPVEDAGELLEWGGESKAPAPADSKAAAPAAASPPAAAAEFKFETGDTVRDKIRALVVTALKEAGAESDALRVLAARIDEHLLADSGGQSGTEYRARSRTLLMNLRDAKNGSLRARIRSGAVSPQQLVTMPIEELANEEVKAERAAIKDENLTQSTFTGPPMILSNEFKCASCGGQETKYAALAERRDIAKAETWSSSNSSAAMMLITCVKCNHTWQREAL